MNTLIQFWNKIYDNHRLLAISGALYGGLFFFFLTMYGCDPREIMGVNAWVKPSKFALSGLLFNWTVAVLLPLYDYSRRKSNIIGNILAIVMSIELAIIGTQAMRGEMSHYNMSTPLNGLLFAAMGIGITVISLIVVLLFIDAFRKKLKTSKAVDWSIKLAWVAVLISFVGGNMMINNMAHNIGIPDGGTGLPFTNWSTEGGDLRVMHFLGLHAIQILPLLSYWYSNKTKSPASISPVSFSWITASIYIGLILFTWWQSLNGMPFLNIELNP